MSTASYKTLFKTSAANSSPEGSSIPAQIPALGADSSRAAANFLRRAAAMQKIIDAEKAEKAEKDAAWKAMSPKQRIQARIDRFEEEKEAKKTRFHDRVLDGVGFSMSDDDMSDDDMSDDVMSDDDGMYM